MQLLLKIMSAAACQTEWLISTACLLRYIHLVTTPFFQVVVLDRLFAAGAGVSVELADAVAEVDLKAGIPHADHTLLADQW